MGNVYMELVEEIDRLTHTVMGLREEIEKYLKMGGVFDRPADIHGIDYTTERVQTSGKISFGEAMQRISDRNEILRPYLEKLEQLRKIKESFDLLYEKNCNTVQEKVFYLRFVKNMTQKQTAEKLGYSERQIQRIEKKVKKCKKSAEEH